MSLLYLVQVHTFENSSTFPEHLKFGKIFTKKNNSYKFYQRDLKKKKITTCLIQSDRILIYLNLITN